MIATFPLSSWTSILLGPGYQISMYILETAADKNSLSS